MTHTPGPWSCDYGDFAAYCQTGAEVCEVTKGNHDDGTKIPDDEMEANLRLVAAAPELLAALKQAAAFIQSHNECLSVPSGSGDTQWNDYCIGVAEHLTAVISKAEGGE